MSDSSVVQREADYPLDAVDREESGDHQTDRTAMRVGERLSVEFEGEPGPAPAPHAGEPTAPPFLDRRLRRLPRVR